MSNKVIELLPKKSDHDLKTLRRNAMRTYCSDAEPARKLIAEKLLDAIDLELEHRHLPGMIKTFLEYYEGGFYGETFFAEERDYKLNASTACRKLLNKCEFSQLLDAKNWVELFDRVKTLVQLTNLIQASFERPQLLDRIREEGAPELFYPALYECLHGCGTASIRLGVFADTLYELGLGKWTYASYFVFLNEPDVCMFVKPEGLKKSVAISQYPLEYESRPSAELYEQILAYSNWLKEKLRGLKPRDMIDVQSFIWHMAPTGKDSRD